MVEPLLQAHTEWVDHGDEKRLKWTCPECGTVYLQERRHATITCEECEKIMEAAEYDCSGEAPDPENPKRVLRRIAKRRGLPHDYYYPDEQVTADDPLEF